MVSCLKKQQLHKNSENRQKKVLLFFCLDFSGTTSSPRSCNERVRSASLTTSPVPRISSLETGGVTSFGGVATTTGAGSFGWGVGTNWEVKGAGTGEGGEEGGDGGSSDKSTCSLAEVDFASVRPLDCRAGRARLESFLLTSLGESSRSATSSRLSMEPSRRTLRFSSSFSYFHARGCSVRKSESEQPPLVRALSEMQMSHMFSFYWK